MSSEAKPLEVSVSSSVGGKVQIIKFEYSEDYHFSQTEKWSVPEDWTEEQVAEFRKTLQTKLDTDLQEQAQVRVNELIEQKYGASNE